LIRSNGFAVDRPTVNVRNESVTRNNSACPLCGIGIEANLIRLWRVDPFKPDLNVADG
jgi:hypothetical protein